MPNQDLPGGLMAPVPTGSNAFTTVDVSTPAVNTAAVVTYAAVPLKRHIIEGIAYSYSGGAPVGGNLKIQNGTDVVFSMDIPEGGSDTVIFPSPKYGSVNKSMVITLSAGGSGVTGKVSVLSHRVI